MSSSSARVAIWTLTEGGVELGRRLMVHLDRAHLYAGASVTRRTELAAEPFERLRDAVTQKFGDYEAHVFIMATGIVVRTLAGLIRHKSVDPAVLVMDEAGRHVISLLSGHLGGANALTVAIADHLGADPVITTATDIRGVPAIDLIARERGLAIENHAAIRHISAALLRGETVDLYDPCGRLRGALADADIRGLKDVAGDNADPQTGGRPTVVVDDIQIDLPPEVLILRPASLFVGLGCNRGTPAGEMRELLDTVLADHALAPKSLAGFASVDLKADEAGIIDVADEFGLPLEFFTREQLAQVTDIRNPSPIVEKHIGIPSVCEAAALLAAGSGKLIVPKQTTRNVTVAVARRSCISSV
ncbi:MAG: cobalt-precorrin 5A hydrolase [Desulfobacterales bacterium]|nr:cobalt-precorrin 5A hydrolase [Desulfobacterales bacterium]